MKIKVINTGDTGCYKYEATLEDINFQFILNGFVDFGEDYFAKYGSTKQSAKNKLIKEMKRISKITKEFNKKVDEL